MLASSHAHAQLGTIPDWIAAIGTTLAFFVAFAVFALEVKERRRRQASQVAAWLERAQPDAILHIANSSEVPVYNIQVTPQILGRDYETFKLPVLAPKKDDATRTVPVPLNEEISNEYLGAKILFTDSSGRRWNRNRDGKLRRRWRSYR